MSTQDDEMELSLVSETTSGENGSSRTGTCSFCGKSAAEVTCLLAGADALICDACIAHYKAQLKAEL